MWSILSLYMNNSERSQTDRSLEISRRTFLRDAAVLFAAGAVSSIPDMKTLSSELQPFSADQIGWNLRFRSQPDEMVKKVLALPGKTVRIPVHMDYVWKDKNKFDFDAIDRIIEAALENGKLIDLGMGIKTTEWPEVHITEWQANEFPYLTKDGALLDENEDFQNYTFEYLDAVSKRYLPIKEIRTIQVENEPFSKRLSVTRNRSISPEFNRKEVALVRGNDPYNRPFLQNIPLDTPESILAALDADIIGINIYNQHRERWLEKVPQKAFEMGLWTYIGAIASMVRLSGKQIKVTEFQIAAWNNEPFSTNKMVEGLREIKRMSPEYGTSLWDAEKVIASGDKQHISLLHEMVA